jgi:acyl-coenzyme A synthetase/AMP-(fatty) acid ligase
VTVCLQRSPELIISLVVGLKIGAAYMTIDSDTPQEGKDFIVQDVGAQLVTSGSTGKPKGVPREGRGIWP